MNDTAHDGDLAIDRPYRVRFAERIASIQ